MTRAPEPCARPRSTSREDAILSLLRAGVVSLEAAADTLPASVGAASRHPAHRRREVARGVLGGLCDDGRAVPCSGGWRLR